MAVTVTHAVVALTNKIVIVMVIMITGIALAIGAILGIAPRALVSCLPAQHRLCCPGRAAASGAVAGAVGGACIAADGAGTGAADGSPSFLAGFTSAIAEPMGARLDRSTACAGSRFAGTAASWAGPSPVEASHPHKSLIDR